MSSTTEDIWDEVLVGTHSRRIYDDIDKNTDLDNYKKFCELLNKDDESDFFTLCKKVVRNVEYLSKMVVNDEYKHRCSHYRFWFYNELLKLIQNNRKMNNIKSIIDKFLHVQNNITLWYREFGCHYNFYSKDLEELNEKQEEKRLYDYFQNHFSIQNTTTCEDVKKDKYKKYLDGVNSMYKNHKYKNKCCYDLWWNNCLHYFNCHDDYDPEKMLASLQSSSIGSCDNKKKGASTLPSGSLDHSQNSEEDIKKFHYARCKETSHGMFLCNLLPVNFKSPKRINNPVLHYHCTSDTCKYSQNLIPPPDKVSKYPMPVKTTEEKSTSKFEIGKYTIPESFRITKTRAQEKKNNNEHIDKHPLQEKRSTPFIQPRKSPIKWLFGEGKMNCSAIKPHEDPYKLCAYKNKRLNKQSYLEETYTESQKGKNLMSILSSILPNAKEAGRINGETSYKIRDSGTTNFPDSSTNYVEISKDENNILYNIFFRIAIVVLLTLGLIFVFVIYYKYTPFGSCLRRNIIKEKRINKSIYMHAGKSQTQGPRKIYRNSQNRQCCIAYQTS
ncbi:variable surface protein [Plasmodium gonderi]|uniref:Variable surface protein n=1 Tax=Plasmodium gonderi TaxID=77519 RepID=A0A1Y1JQK6_PLAGO|nr:variable surface protein [Plasmodium gonderi]GAW82743.1 variable surface protein [Plasmodium gonderi]